MSQCLACQIYSLILASNMPVHRLGFFIVCARYEGDRTAFCLEGQRDCDAVAIGVTNEGATVWCCRRPGCGSALVHTDTEKEHAP